MVHKNSSINDDEIIEMMIPVLQKALFNNISRMITSSFKNYFKNCRLICLIKQYFKFQRKFFESLPFHITRDTILERFYECYLEEYGVNFIDLDDFHNHKRNLTEIIKKADKDSRCQLKRFIKKFIKLPGEMAKKSKDYYISNNLINSKNQNPSNFDYNDEEDSYSLNNLKEMRNINSISEKTCSSIVQFDDKIEEEITAFSSDSTLYNKIEDLSAINFQDVMKDDEYGNLEFKSHEELLKLISIEEKLV